MNSIMIRMILLAQLAAAAALVVVGCSDDGDPDGGVSVDASSDGKPATDFKGTGLPPNYKPYPCPTPGKACNAHDACAVHPICGPDKLCWPQFLMDCDDSLSCTTDTCAGLGLCNNAPKAGFCVVGYKQTVDGGGGSTQFKCVTKGTINPADPCLACNPTETDGGISDNKKWMPISGGKCDDQTACTRDDTCVNGACKGTYYGNLCADSFGCTEDKCDGVGGCSGNFLKSNYCLISGTCYKDSGKHPSGSCYECDVKKSQSAWTAINNTCLINGKCYNHGDKHPLKCAECDTAVSTTSWTVPGSACLINNVCKKPGDKDTIGCSECAPSKTKYAWSSIANLCKIFGKCYKKGDKHAGGCAECDAAVSATAWTVKGSACLINNVCKKPGDKDSIACTQCAPTKNKYDWTPISGLCKISGKCHKTNDPHPEKCATCQPAVSPTAWTVSGNSCLIYNKCKKPGDKDLSGCGACAPSKAKYAWSALPGLCKIDGKCYTKGQKHPQACAACDPSNSSTSWTPSGNGCLIGLACFAAGAKHSSGCGSCDPTKNKTGWTVTGNSCLIGNTCYSNGTKEPGGCATCDAAKNKNDWTRAATCKVVHDWSRGFGGSSSDYGYALATDANGNVYITGYFYNSISFGGSTLYSKGSYDIFVASFTPAGTHRWSKSFGSSSSDYGYGVAVDGNGNVYLTGSFYYSVNFGGSTLTSQGGRDIFVASFTSDGKHRWSKSFGDKSSDYGYAVATDNGGNVYITGYYYGSTSSSYPGVNFGGGTLKSKGSNDIFLASFTSAGKHRWSKNFGYTSGDYGYGLATDASGNVYVSGYFYYNVNFGGGTITSKGSGDAFLASFSSTGTHRWSKGFGGTSSDYGYDVATDGSGNVYLTGYFYNSANFGGGTLTSKGSGDVYLASYTAGGTHRWSKNFGSTSYDYGYGVTADSKGNVTITGQFYSSANFGGGTLKSNGSTDIFIASYTTSGAHRWSRNHGGTSSDYGRGLAADGAGNVYVTGYFYGTADFGGGKIKSKSSDMFLVKLKP